MHENIIIFLVFFILETKDILIMKILWEEQGILLTNTKI